MCTDKWRWTLTIQVAKYLVQCMKSISCKIDSMAGAYVAIRSSKRQFPVAQRTFRVAERRMKEGFNMVAQLYFDILSGIIMKTRYYGVYTHVADLLFNNT